MRIRESDEKYVRNQCSLVIRVNGEETEIPVTFGMTSDEILMIYPFLMQLVNEKIENPALQFSRNEERGLYSNLSKEEYDAELCRMMAQSKFWYKKPEAGLLDIAIRFALDLKLKGFTELVDVFGQSSATESIKIKPLTQEEASVIMRQLNLEEPDQSETLDNPDESVIDNSDITENREYEDVAVTENSSDDEQLITSSTANIHLDETFGAEEEPESQSEPVNPLEGQTLEEVAQADLENIDVSKYQSTYEVSELSEDDIRDGLLVRDGDTESDEIVSEESDSNDNAVVESQDELYEPIDEDEVDDIDDYDLDEIDDDNYEEDFEEIDFTEDDSSNKE